MTRTLLTQTITRQIMSFVIACLVMAELLIYIPSASHFQYRWFQTQWQHFLVQFDQQDTKNLTKLQKAYDNRANQSSVQFHTPHFICWQDDTGSQHELGTKQGATLSFDLAKSPLSYIVPAIQIMANIGPSQVTIFDSRQDSQFKATWSIMLIRDELRDYAFRILSLTLLIGLLIIAPLYWFLTRKFVAPLRVMTSRIEHFSADPTMIIEPMRFDGASQEITNIADALAQMTEDVRRALRQKERLADIGEATAKINHDLRNILVSATLVTDTLRASDDPQIKRIAPHIERAISDAASMTQNMMHYLSEPKPETIIPFTLSEMATNLSYDAGIEVVVHGADSLSGTPNLFYRLLLNLARNAKSAMATNLTIDVWRAGHLAVIDISDDGPGIPKDLKKHIFSAFYSGHKSNTGLGLAIAKDIAVAMGGDLRLSRSSKHGSEFRLSVPVKWLTD